MKELIINQNALKSIINDVKNFVVGKTDMRDYLKFVWFDVVNNKLSISATDGVQIIQKTFDVDFDDCRFYIPFDFLKDFSINYIDLIIKRVVNHSLLNCGQSPCKTIETITYLYNGNSLYQDPSNRKPNLDFIFNPYLKEMVNFTLNKKDFTNKLKSLVPADITQIVKINLQEFGIIDNTIDYQEIGFDIKRINKCLKALKGKTFTLRLNKFTNTKAVVMFNDNTQIAIMPLRINN